MEEIDTENETKLASIKCFKADTGRIKDLARRLKLIDRRYAVSCQYVIAAALDALDRETRASIAALQPPSSAR